MFRSRLAEGVEDEYRPLAAAMLERASAMPGFVDFASYSSPDGGRVSIITFASWQDHVRWRDDPAHRAAQRRGAAHLYASYEVTVAEELVAWHPPRRL